VLGLRCSFWKLTSSGSDRSHCKSSGVVYDHSCDFRIALVGFSAGKLPAFRCCSIKRRVIAFLFLS
jgi:hypothetical protein